MDFQPRILGFGETVDDETHGAGFLDAGEQARYPRGVSIATSRETPAPGIVVWQPLRGFRYGAEAFWLAGFALEPGVPGTALDLGTGSGIAALLLAGRGADALGIDLRPEWEPLWARSLVESAVAGRITLRVRGVIPGEAGGLPEKFEAVVSNPPYFAADQPTAPDPWKAAARTETVATLADFVRFGLDRLAPGGRLCLVIPVDREADAIRAAAAAGAGPARWVRVGKKRVLLDFRAGVGGCEVVAVGEADPLPARWYALARGSPEKDGL